MANLQRPRSTFTVGLGAIVLGLVCLRVPPADGVLTLTVAPVLLVLGFVVLVPLGLWPRSGLTDSAGGADRAVRFGAAGVFVTTALVYLMTLRPGPGWWNSGEYVTCSYTLGVTGPPGSFLLQLAGRLWSFVPLFDSPAVRINVLVALITAAAAVVVYITAVRMVRSWLGETDRTRPVAIASGVLAALTLAFCESVWHHATYTNPYALSLLTAAVIIYVGVRWWECADEPGGGNLLLVAAFVFGLDLSVHRSNLLLVPAFVLLVALRQPRALRDRRLWLGGIGLFVLGSLLQFGVMLRAQLGPELNMGAPDSLGGLWDYASLSQYGIRVFGSDLLQRRGPLWDYQISEMCLRYFGWNFVGMDGEGSRVAWSGLWAIPAVVGAIGAVAHFVRRGRQALFLLGALLMTSLGAVLYLNVPEGFFREMDRHFLSSFMVFALWVGVGAAALVTVAPRVSGNKAGRSRVAVWIGAGVLVVALPVNQLVSNWGHNDQSGNTTDDAFGRDMLESCPRDAILITHGDSDTFLPWYLRIAKAYDRM